jgi:hypothetical protein
MFVCTKWYYCLACNVSNANILSLWIEIMMFGLCNNGWRWNRSNYTFCRCGWCWFDAYDALVNTLLWRAKGVVANIPYVNTTSSFLVAAGLSAVQASALNSGYAAILD